jgi:hypothetical protein
MLYLTPADAQIACFQDKERWSFWRAQTAIHLADDDGNPATVGDRTGDRFCRIPRTPITPRDTTA